MRRKKSPERYKTHSNGKNILFLGYSGFPYGLAEMQRILLLSKAVIREGNRVIVIGSRGMHSRDQHPDLRKIGHRDGTMYIYSSDPFRIVGFLKRNLTKPFERVMEFFLVLKLKRKYGVDAAILSTEITRHVLAYWFFSRILRFKILLNYVEYNSAIAARRNIKTRINDFLFDKYAVRMSDGAIVISEYLIDITKKNAPGVPFIKIPVIVDLDRYNGIKHCPSEGYFIFCGAAGYTEIIFFIIEAFEKIHDNSYSLYMVINGRGNQINVVKERIAASSRSGMIKTFTGVSDFELSSLYKNAAGLLIPLRPIIQDIARFPHKFGEYLASGNPIVTTNYGEVRYYFRDMENALIADNFDEDLFAEKMEFIISNPERSKDIGNRGREFAAKHIDYKVYGKMIMDFLD